jgi:ATP-dependent Zn protease
MFVLTRALILPFLQPNVGRYTTGVWTRGYLEQQLRLMLAGRAAEELVFGRDELSSLHQAKLMMAREVRGRQHQSTALHSFGEVVQAARLVQGR